ARCVHREAGESAREEHADRAANHVNANDVERIVVVEDVLEVDGAVAEQPGRGADNDRRPRLYVAGRRSDRGEPGDSACGEADAGRPAAAPPLDTHPGEHRGAGAELSVHHRIAGDLPSGHRAARVEPEPPEPQDAGAKQDQRNVVRWFELVTSLQVDGGGERRCTRQLMNDGAAGEVDRVKAARAEDSAAPLTMPEPA